MLFANQIENEERPVLVLGAAGIDIVGQPKTDLVSGTSNPAIIHTTYGGTARNFAENLARLGHPTIFLGAVGRDPVGRQLIRHIEKAGVNVEQILRVKGAMTGSYLAVVNDVGELQFALDDMQVVEALTPVYVEQNAYLFKEAALLFVDANLPEETLAVSMALAKQANLPVAADPTSVSLTTKLKPYLSQISLLTPNYKEASLLCDDCEDAPDSAQGMAAAKELVAQGVEMAIVTLAEFGLSYATSEISGHIPAIRTQIVDPTGGGDALSAAVVFALLNNIPVDEAVRLGVSAASMTLRHHGAVYADLSLELLYDQLL